jgi:hypothetical protein
MDSNRQVALDAAVRAWEISAQDYPPGNDGERILQLATKFETWLERPGPAVALTITASNLRPIPSTPQG